MRMTVEIEVGEIFNRLGGAVRGHLPCPHEPPKTLRHFDVRQVRRMDVVVIPKEPGLDPDAERRLQEEFQQGRGIDDDHADSRSARMTSAADVFKVTRFRA